MDIGIVAIGRMGWVHATHLLELERETAACRLTGVVDADADKLARFAQATGYRGPTFTSLDAYLAAGAAQCTLVAAPTADHRAITMQLVEHDIAKDVIFAMI